MMSDLQVVSFSEIDAGRQCAYKHLLAYKERWVSPDQSAALRKGTNWHSMLEVHYLSLMATQPLTKKEIEQGKKRKKLSDADRLATAVKAVEDYVNKNMEVYEEDLELLEWMYTGYFQHYSIDPDWRIVAVEYAPEIPLPNPDGGPSRFMMKAKIDLIVRDMNYNRLILIDHKSGKNLPSEKELDLDDQFGIYWFLMRELGHKIFAVIHSAARAHKNKDQVKNFQPLEERFLRTYMSRTDEELTRVAAEAYWTAETLYAYDPEKTPRSTDAERCRWRCGFTDACLMARKGAPRAEAMKSFDFVQNFNRH
jgi:PD-(D/E)XK nuclease superfamily